MRTSRLENQLLPRANWNNSIIFCKFHSCAKVHYFLYCNSFSYSMIEHHVSSRCLSTVSSQPINQPQPISRVKLFELPNQNAYLILCFDCRIEELNTPSNQPWNSLFLIYKDTILSILIRAQPVPRPSCAHQKCHPAYRTPVLGCGQALLKQVDKLNTIRKAELQAGRL